MRADRLLRLIVLLQRHGHAVRSVRARMVQESIET